MITDPTERARRVQTMFGRITRRYDLMNFVMTGGRDQAWRRIAAAELALPSNALCLDLATGTADLALAVRARFPDSRVVGADFSETILRAGVAKAARKAVGGVTFAVGDALSLSFPDATFDGLVSGFLLRNVVDLRRCLRELMRVCKPGSRVVSMEITHPQTPVFRSLFALYFNHIMPVIGGVISGDYNAYKYLPTSLAAFPAAEPLKAIMQEVGFREVRYRLLGLGSMAVHVGIVPHP
ncbi:MAG: ubiquinone/menaquinone biosynthesis methyltransferase [Thermoflexales bacterium]|nr:ubiquinone/menaquinone biosynthesis methyltransferase [Thermoflexales bacterium]